MSSILEEIERWQREIRAAQLNPRPARIRVHPAVPPTRLPRQWNTRGELEIWVNPRIIARVPRIAQSKADPMTVFTGIPVIYE